MNLIIKMKKTILNRVQPRSFERYKCKIHRVIIILFILYLNPKTGNCVLRSKCISSVSYNIIQNVLTEKYYFCFLLFKHFAMYFFVRLSTRLLIKYFFFLIIAYYYEFIIYYSISTQVANDIEL